MEAEEPPMLDEMVRALDEEGQKVRGFISSNRSDTLLSLFDFLLEQSLAGHRPKESEIAQNVFPDSRTAPGQQGSRVRVGVYRLRKKLDLYYADKKGARLNIPQGEYGFVLDRPELVPEVPAAECAVEEATSLPDKFQRIWVLAAILLALNAAAALLYWHHTQGDLAGKAVSPLWTPFVREAAPTYVVMGDYFLFSSRSGGNGGDETVVQDLSITSPDAFYEYLMQNQAAQKTLENQDLYAVSSSLLAPVSRLASYLKPTTLKPVTSSALDAEMMKSANLIYVGALDALSPWLRGPWQQMSGFRCGTRCYDVIDKTSGRRFLSDSPYLLGDGIVPRRDYGYIASLPGPSGRQILILSGTGDVGARQMVSVATDAKMVEQLRRRLGGNLTAFEALYQVRTMFDQSYGSTLIIVRPIKTRDIWDKAFRD